MNYFVMEEFFEQVKGRPIRFSTWEMCIYFIPIEFHGFFLKGMLYRYEGSIGTFLRFSAQEGFLPSEFGKWEIVHRNEHSIEFNSGILNPSDLCVCDLQLLMQRGCTCGGFESEMRNRNAK